jgi:type IV fimbrial biogenesis protein FimT
MTNLSTSHGKKMINTSRIDCFFVGHFVPFVGSLNPHKLPLVCRNRPTGNNLGFTLIELIITLVIVGVLLGIGVPNFRSFIQNSRITSQSNELVGVLATARSEALKRNLVVNVCRSADPTAGTPVCTVGGSGTWETGWLVYVDFSTTTTLANGSFAAADGDTLLKVYPALAGNNTLRGNSAALVDFVSFKPDGTTTLLTAVTPHHFKLCDTRGASSARAIVLEPTGRPRIDRLTTFATLTCP